jgi:hypothetical protein
MQFDYHYACENYDINGKLVTRKEWSPVERCKHTCLVSMINMFTDKYIEDKFIPSDFEHIDGPIRDSTSRCICSQLEPSITHHIIRHKETSFCFKIGSDCFKKLFESDLYHQDVLDFFKKPCKYCKCKIKKRDPNRAEFCNLKCKVMYDDSEYVREHKRWIIEIRLTKEARNADNEMTPLMKWEHIQFERLIKFNAL